MKFELTEAESRAAAATQGFNLDFFQAVCQHAPADENVTTSPLSASILLSMFANACDDTHRSQIASALGCRDIDALNSLANKYLLALPLVDESVDMTLANSVWYHNKYTLSPDFASIVDKYYAGDKYDRNLQTGDPAIVSEINKWVSDKTSELIKEIVTDRDLNAQTIAIMANAIYFKGQWANPFEPENTAEKEFKGATATSVVDMMFNGGMQHYAEAESFRAIKMEFGKGAFEAVLVLPNEKTNLNALIASDELSGLNMLRYEDTPVNFHLPRLKLSPEKIALNVPLATLGISDLGQLNKYVIFTTPVEAMSKIFQKATIEFTEEGAEGAGVTWTGLELAPGPDAPATTKPEMNFNRPFAFFINEATTGACLFATRVCNL